MKAREEKRKIEEQKKLLKDQKSDEFIKTISKCNYILT